MDPPAEDPEQPELPGQPFEPEQTAPTETAEGQPAEKPGFFLRLKSYTEADWENELTLYIYRMAPVTDRRASGEPLVSIAKLSEPIDEDYILKNREWGGSGKYKLMLTRTPPGAKQGKCMDSMVTRILNQAYPPVVPPGEWVEDPRNKQWAWARKKEDPQPTVQAVQQDRGLTVDDAFKIIGQAREWVQSAKDQSLSGSNIVELIKQTQTANDPQKIIDAARAMLEIMKPGPPPDRDAETERFLKMMALMKETFQPPPAPPPPDPMEQLKAMAETFRTLIPPPAPVPDMAAQIKAQAETFKALKDVFGGDGDESGPARRSNMNGWQEMLQPLFGQIGPVLTIIGQAVVHKLTATPETPAPPANVTGAAPSGSIPPPPQNGGTPVPNEDLATHITQWIAPTLTQHLSNGWSGEEFAETLANSATQFKGIPIAGTFVFHQLKAAGKEALAELCKKNPAIWATVPQPQEETLSRFLDEFLSWNPNADEPDDDTPPPASAPKGGRKGAAQ